MKCFFYVNAIDSVLYVVTAETIMHKPYRYRMNHTCIILQSNETYGIWGKLCNAPTDESLRSHLSYDITLSLVNRIRFKMHSLANCRYCDIVLHVCIKIRLSLSVAKYCFGYMTDLGTSDIILTMWSKLAGTSAALLPRCLSNFRAILPLQNPISRLRDFTRFGGKTSYRLVNRSPG